MWANAQLDSRPHRTPFPERTTDLSLGWWLGLPLTSSFLL